MNILVTGGAGYIGSATAEALIRAGHTVTVYDSLITGHRQAVPQEATFVEADLSYNHSLSQTFTDPTYDAIIHLGASIEGGESRIDPGRYYQNNLTNSLALVETAVQSGVRRVMLAPTAANFQPSNEPLTEDSA